MLPYKLSLLIIDSSIIQNLYHLAEYKADTRQIKITLYILFDNIDKLIYNLIIVYQ